VLGRHNLTVAHLSALVTDTLLVDRCKDGDDVATRELFRLYQKRVHATLYRVLGNRSEMDDLMHDAFMQVFRGLHTDRGDARLSTWIDRITVRVAYRHMNRSKKIPMPIEHVEEVEAHGPTPSSIAASRQGARHLYRALAQLPAASQVAFALYEIDGRSIADIATIVGAAKSATKLRIWRARRALMKIAKNDPVLAEFLDGTSLGESR
jgi:RNA polymerase sigma-70 factor (ECF subfamily)